MILNGIPTAQTEKQMILLYRVIQNFNIATFIELGAFMGGLTYEMIQTYPEMIIHSFDLGGHLDSKVADRPEVHLGDVFAAETVEFIRQVINSSPGPVLVFCDNGNKIGEFDLYYPLLRVGDLIQVHDFPDEATPEFVARVLRDCRDLEPINLDLYLKNGTVIWKKVMELAPIEEVIIDDTEEFDLVQARALASYDSGGDVVIDVLQQWLNRACNEIERLMK